MASLTSLPPAGPPRATAAQWTLAVFCLALAGVAQLCTAHDDLAVVAVVSALASAPLVWLTFIEGLRARVLGKFFLIATNWSLFYLEGASSALSGGFQALKEMPLGAPRYDPALIRQAYLYIALFQLALLAGYALRPQAASLVRWARSRTDGGMNCWGLRAALAACSFIPILAMASFSPRAAIESLINSYREFTKPAVDPGLILHLRSIGMYGGSLLLAEATLFRTPFRWLSLLMGVLVAASATMKGARHVLLFVLVPVAVIALLRSRRSWNSKRLAAWLAGILVILFLFQFQVAVRERGWGRMNEVTARELLSMKATAQFDALLFAVYLVPKHHNYFHDIAEPYFIAYGVPRSIWPEKPVIPSWKYYNDVYTNADQVWNVTPSIIGQYHMGWGVAGVLYIGLWLGLLAFLTDKLLAAIDAERQRGLAIVLGMMYAFLISSFRFYAPFYFSYLVFAFIAMLAVTHRERPSAVQASAAFHGRPAAPLQMTP